MCEGETFRIADSGYKPAETTGDEVSFKYTSYATDPPPSLRIISEDF
jgi:hypothetical protein